MTKISNDDWFEISDRDWLPSFKPKKLKLLADEGIPEPIIAEIRSAGIAIRAFPQKMKRSADSDVLRLAQQEGRVLLTLDAHFWDDRKHPLYGVQQGLIYVAEPPEQHERILRAFGLVYGCFAKAYPLDWWNHMKVRAVLGEFEIKMRTWEGKIARYRMKLRRGYVIARES